MDRDKMEKQYISASGAAKLIGCTQATVCQWLTADPPRLDGFQLDNGNWVVNRRSAEREAKKPAPNIGRPRVGRTVA